MKNRLSLLVVVLFTLTLAAMYRNHAGTDLTSSYLGCRLFVTGQTGHLYSQDATSYNLVTDPVWEQAAANRGFAKNAFLPPYVQTPLWAFTLQPSCSYLNWPAFNNLFILIISVCFGALIWLTVCRWTPRLMHPALMAAICLLFLASDTVRYSMQLSQTHIIFILLTLLAVVWARDGSPASAGFLLAVAAAVKITPGLLLIYWLVTKQFRAAAGFILASIALFAVATIATGSQLELDYLHNMSKVSKILLVAYNNQSFAAWWAAASYPASELHSFHSFVLPLYLRIASVILLLVSAIIGGYLDRRFTQRDPSVPPYGALFALIGATLFTPIAWSHYFVILLVAIVFLMDEMVRRRSYLLMALTGALVCLNFYAEAASHLARIIGVLPALVRNQFYAALIAMAALVVLRLKRGDASDQAVAA